MTIEEALVTHLVAHAGLSALIGDRVYPQPLPQAAVLPAVTYALVSRPRLMSHAGLAGATAPRVQFDCWAATASAARAVAAQVVAALAGYQGLLGGAGGVQVQAGLPADERDGAHEPQLGLYHRIVEIILWHAE